MRHRFLTSTVFSLLAFSLLSCSTDKAPANNGGGEVTIPNKLLDFGYVGYTLDSNDGQYPSTPDPVEQIYTITNDTDQAVTYDFKFEGEGKDFFEFHHNPDTEVMSCLEKGDGFPKKIGNIELQKGASCTLVVSPVKLNSPQVSHIQDVKEAKVIITRNGTDMRVSTVDLKVNYIQTAPKVDAADGVSFTFPTTTSIDGTDPAVAVFQSEHSEAINETNSFNNFKYTITYDANFKKYFSIDNKVSTCKITDDNNIKILPDTKCYIVFNFTPKEGNGTQVTSTVTLTATWDNNTDDDIITLTLNGAVGL